MVDLNLLLRRLTKEHAEEILEYHRSYRALEVGPPPLRALEDAKLDAFYSLCDERDRLEEYDFSGVEADLHRLLRGLELSPPDLRRALYEMQRARVMATLQAVDEYDHDFDGSRRADEFEPASSTDRDPTTAAPTVSLGELVYGYVKDKYATGRWRQGKPSLGRERHLHRFIAAVGDRPVRDVTREMLRFWRDDRAKELKPGSCTSSK